jgi:hypothetical protein
MTANTTLNAGSGGDIIATDDFTTAKAQRVKIMLGATGADGGNITNANPVPVQSVNTARTYLTFFANAAAAGTTGTETAIAISRATMDGTAAGTAANSQTPTSGKRFRITTVTFGSRGNATSSAQTTNFSIRVNSAGAVTTTSSVALSAGTATPASVSAWDRWFIDFGSDGPEIVGNGTLQWGVTANSTYTNAPTWYVTITGYEY